MVTACAAAGGQRLSASSSAASNLLTSWRIGQGICATRSARPASIRASLRLAPPRSQPTTLAILSSCGAPAGLVPALSGVHLVGGKAHESPGSARANTVLERLYG